ncbi:PepSY domain-containing protein [Viridibacillus sp. NPDC093762]|uniref:PepSY domain-containing protein n=1 Tax=Viridibacillus sp. NPDC093762 TaxID=3390720 RepID=UPI003D054184
MKKMITALAITGSLAVSGVVAAAGIQTNSGKILSSKEISKKALSYVKGTVYKVELDKEKGVQVYEVDVRGKSKEYELTLDAKTGNLLEKKTETTKVSNSVNNKKVIGLAKAKEIALKSVKGSVKKAKLDREDGIYEIEIIRAGYEYDFDINAYTGKIVKKEKEKISKKVVTGKVIGLEKAKQIALNNVGGTVQKAKLDKSDGVYEIEIINGATEYDFEIDAKTGNVIKKESEVADDVITNTKPGIPSTGNTEKPSKPSTSNKVIGIEKAKEIALKSVNGTVKKAEYDREDGVYDFEILTTDYEYDIEVDAITGKVMITDKERITKTPNPVTPFISEQKASQIALTKAKGTITKIELDEEDGVYEVEVKDGMYEYELEIDAKTGAILDFEKEYEDD